MRAGFKCFLSYLTDFDKTINIDNEGYCTVPTTTENKKMARIQALIKNVVKIPRKMRAKLQHF